MRLFLRRPRDEDLAQRLAAITPEHRTFSRTGITEGIVAAADFVPPAGFDRSYRAEEIGQGEACFRAAREALRRWSMFDIVWTWRPGPIPPVQPGTAIVFAARFLGLWSVHSTVVSYVIDTPSHYGFGYATLREHAVVGEERFLARREANTDRVIYEMVSVWRPANWLTRLGRPLLRIAQERFFRDATEAVRAAAERLGVTTAPDSPPATPETATPAAVRVAREGE